MTKNTNKTEDWVEDTEWKISKKVKWSILHPFTRYWYRKSWKNGTIYYTSTLFFQKPTIRSTYGEGFDDGAYKVGKN